MIYVKTKPNRVAYEGYRGKKIPNDRFVPVTQTPYIERLLSVHGDIEVQPTAQSDAEVFAQESKS